MFTVSKSQFDKFDTVIFEETRVQVILKLFPMLEITKEEATILFDNFRKPMLTYKIITEAGMLRFLLIIQEYHVTLEDLFTTDLKAIFTYPDREEELKIDKFHEYLINLHDSEL